MGLQVECVTHITARKLYGHTVVDVLAVSRSSNHDVCRAGSFCSEYDVGNRGRCIVACRDVTYDIGFYPRVTSVLVQCSSLDGVRRFFGTGSVYAVGISLARYVGRGGNVITCLEQEHA